MLGLVFAWSAMGVGFSLEGLALRSGEHQHALDWLQMSQHRSHGLRSVLLPWTTPGLAHPGSSPLLLLLAASSLLGPRRAARTLPLWLGALGFHLLALGPAVDLPLGLGTLPLPYRWLPHVLPFFTRFHHPYRCLLLGDLLLALLAAQGLGLLLARLHRPRPWAGVLIGGVMAAGVLQVYPLLPLPSTPYPTSPEAYRALAQDAPQGVVLAVHRAGRPGAGGLDANPLLAQLDHGAPVCCLPLPASLEPDELHSLRSEQPLFAMLTGPLAEQRLANLPAGDLRSLGFSHLVVHFEPPAGTPPDALPQLMAASRGRLAVGPCPACQALLDRFGPPLVQQELERSHLAVWRLGSRSEGP